MVNSTLQLVHIVFFFFNIWYVYILSEQRKTSVLYNDCFFGISKKSRDTTDELELIFLYEGL